MSGFRKETRRSPALRTGGPRFLTTVDIRFLRARVIGGQSRPQIGRPHGSDRVLGVRRSTCTTRLRRSCTW